MCTLQGYELVGDTRALFGTEFGVRLETTVPLSFLLEMEKSGMRQQLIVDI